MAKIKKIAIAAAALLLSLPIFSFAATSNTTYCNDNENPCNIIFHCESPDNWLEVFYPGETSPYAQPHYQTPGVATYDCLSQAPEPDGFGYSFYPGDVAGKYAFVEYSAEPVPTQEENDAGGFLYSTDRSATKVGEVDFEVNATYFGLASAYNTLVGFAGQHLPEIMFIGVLLALVFYIWRIFRKILLNERYIASERNLQMQNITEAVRILKRKVDRL